MNDLCWSPIDGYTVTEVILYYDFPRLFVTQKDNAPDTHYLGLWADALETPDGKFIGDVFFLIPIADTKDVIERIEASGEMEYSDYFAFSKDGSLRWVEARYGREAGDGQTLETRKTIQEAQEDIQKLINEGDEANV